MGDRDQDNSVLEGEEDADHLQQVVLHAHERLHAQTRRARSHRIPASQPVVETQ